MSSYCEFAASDPLHQPYHDHEYGFPVREDSALFERLVLEINQAGLSWATILRKREAFRGAYSGFDIDAVAAYEEADRARLLGDAGIIRNRLKVNAAIENARRLVRLRGEFGSFAAWLDQQHPLRRDEWVKLFKRTFLFTGGEIVGEFLMSTGYLPGAHRENCPVYERIVDSNPPWVIELKRRGNAPFCPKPASE
jgi:DNA-3-methyladenine glycosylase I